MARVELLVTVDKIVSSNLQPVAAASVLVKLRSTGNPVTVYSGETGGTTISNPLVTDSNGRVNGWVDEGSLVLTISGSGITSYNQPYEATRADQLVAIDGARVIAATMPGTALTNSSIPSTKLANGAVLGKHLAESAMPLGTILAWWQPTKPGGGYVIPSGFALANGQTLGPASHDFGGGSVILPNLVGAQPIGADLGLAYGASGSSLGMNGTGGSNTVNLQHTHSIAHTHTINAHSHQVASHAHGMSHTHDVFIPDHSHGIPIQKINAGNGTVVSAVGGSNTFGFGGVGVTTDGGSSGSTGSTAPSTSSQTGGTVTNASSAASSGNGGSATQDMRSAVVGVLYIVKVRNTV